MSNKRQKISNRKKLVVESDSEDEVSNRENNNSSSSSSSSSSSQINDYAIPIITPKVNVMPLIVVVKAAVAPVQPISRINKFLSESLALASGTSNDIITTYVSLLVDIGQNQYFHLINEPWSLNAENSRTLRFHFHNTNFIATLKLVFGDEWDLYIEFDKQNPWPNYDDDVNLKVLTINFFKVMVQFVKVAKQYVKKNGYDIFNRNQIICNLNNRNDKSNSSRFRPLLEAAGFIKKKGNLLTCNLNNI